MRRDRLQKLPYNRSSAFSHAELPPAARVSIESLSTHASDPAQTHRSKLTITPGWCADAVGVMGRDGMGENGQGLLLMSRLVASLEGREGFAVGGG